jgi:hypothetical protein
MGFQWVLEIQLVALEGPHLFVHHVGLGEIEDLDVALARAHHQERVLHAQRQALVRQRLCVRRRLLPQVPVPQRLVPAPCAAQSEGAMR